MWHHHQVVKRQPARSRTGESDQIREAIPAMTGPAAGGKRTASVLAASQPGPPSTSRPDRLRGARGAAAHHKRGMKVENREMRAGAQGDGASCDSRSLMPPRAISAETKPVSKVRIKFRTGMRRSSALVRINTRCADLTRLKTAFAEVQTAIGLSHTLPHI